MQGPAPVYSLADEQRARAESAAWTSFSAPADSAELLTAWLSLLAGRLERVRAALLLTREADGSAFAVAAAWPDPRRDLQYLAPVAQRVLGRREGLVLGADGNEQPPPESAVHAGYPVLLEGELQAAIVLDLGPGSAAALQEALRQLHWGSAWLLDHYRAQRLQQREALLARSAALNELMASALQHRRLQASALAVANELAARLQCERVSIGLEHQGSVRPLALSHTASFDPRADLLRWLGAAMDEVLDLGVAVAHPHAEGEPGLAQTDSARQLGVAALLSVPVRHEAQTVGAICFERNQGPAFTASERDLASAIGELLGPIWVLQQERERSLPARARDAARAFATELMGPNRPGLKLISGSLVLLLAVLALWQTEHRVTAPTVLEGLMQQAAVAPFEGFIAEAPVRAGETVRKGQVLARLDDRELKLERSRWQAEREQLQRRYQVAQAQGDRAAMGVLAAQVAQAQSQLQLAEERLTRASLLAPYDGVVVAGDLSQQIGAPVETGKALFEIAPLQGYRVMLQVDDRDIRRLALGQRGELVLAGLPGETLAISVKRITPVATQKDGRNVFAVEASVLGQPPAGLRPGMEGVGKVAVGERSLLWIWTHRFVDWLRLSLWSWLP